MSPIEPVSSGRARPVLTPSSTSHGLGRLLTGDPSEAAADSRRVAGAFIALVAITAIVLNVGVYRSERDRDHRERWGRLQAEAQDRAGRIRAAVEGFEREVQGVAQALVPESGREFRTPALGVTLAQSSRLLGWRAAEIHATSRGALATISAGPTLPGPPADLVARVIETGAPAVTRLDGSSIAGDWVVAVAPSAASPGSGHALIVWSDLDELLGPSMAPNSRISGVRAYLAGQEAGHSVILGKTQGRAPPDSHRPLPPESERAAADAAADGVRSQLVLHDGAQETWAVTLFIAELDCGLVVSAPRDALGPEASQGFAGLVAFDIAIGLLVVASLIFWRRQYQIGLARRELEVTRRHADRTQAVFDSAFDAILTFGIDGRIRSANRAAERLLQRPIQDLAGQTFDGMVRFEDHALANVEAASGRVSRGLIQRLDGGTSPVELSVAETGTGSDRMYTVVVRDISQKIEAERQIRDFAQGLETSNRRLAELNAQLEEGSRLKSEFLANTSHELRTPLNGMIGFLQLVLDGMCSTPEEEREFLRQALDCSRHLLGLINDVLDIAKIEAGKLTLEIEEIDPRKLLEEVYSVTHIQAVPKGLALRFESPDEPSTRVRADFRKAKQVLINLVGNAIKFTPSGSVTVRATELPDLGYWRFEVVDTGIGIRHDRQAQVFEKFVQADGSTTRTYGGTGLGLAISRSLVELMGGIIGVESEGEGRGTRMHFSLPIWRREGEASAADDHTGERIAGPPGGPLVLVVEDDPSFRSFVTTVLHRNGYRTVESAHAEGAWVLARRLRPAVVVLDYALTCAEGASLRTGWDLAERMTQDERTRHTPLIFVTGFDDEVLQRLKRNAFSKGLEHLGKPIEAPALLAKINAMLGSIQSRPVRVLMADDDPTIVAFVRKVLPESRFHIEVANNGDECLHILRVQPRGFDVLLLDLMMPVVSGYDVLRELTLSGDYRDLPVLILTNFPEARSDEERRLLEHGEVLDVLPKTSVHNHPMILPHIIDWHLQVRRGGPPGPDEDSSDPEPNWQEAA